jgi:predicted methyltransferase
MIRQSFVRTAFAAGLLLAGTGCAAGSASAPASAGRAALAAAIAGPGRTPANVARDRYRHPAETLAFFGIAPTDTVVEIFPGGGWYTEILAPYLAQGGTYYAAASDRQLEGVKAKAAANPGVYGKVRFANFPATAASSVPAGSADALLTFRNVHNLLMASDAAAAEAFRQFHAILKPGGTLGVVEHRLPETGDAALEKKIGYVKISTVRRLAEDAGFEYVGASEVNANPADTKDHPNGVWSLPPTYRGGDVDRARYAAIGESDRMTLKFRKKK